MMRIALLLLAGCHVASNPHSRELAVCSPAPLADEAGFIDLPDEGSSRARLFYSFEPSSLAGAPLAVVFNGGPGVATAPLRALNTGKRRVDIASQEVVANDADWSQFAALLYIDARQTGFSYDVAGSDDPAGRDEALAGAHFTSAADTSQFVRAILAFFDAHPSLRCSRVALVGESYGGVRATRMLEMILHYRDHELAEALQAHFDRVFPQRAGLELAPEVIAEQFFAQVLIQPLVLGQQQLNASHRTVASGTDPYDDSEPDTWESTVAQALLAAHTQAAAFEKLIGVPPAAVAELAAAERGFAVRELVPFDGRADGDLAGVLGAVGPYDAYFLLAHAGLLPDTTSGDAFVDNLRYVDTLITDALHDQVIVSAVIPQLLATWPGVAGVATAGGSVSVSFSDGSMRSFRFPQYDAGHMVELRQPAALRDDVRSLFSDHDR
jgi:hypothetical protein